MTDNNNPTNKILPFEIIKLPTSGRQETGETCVEPFIENVMNALEADLQDDKSFGCKIKECHTHAGSKIHFNSFVEAELLFHNSYYNERFASLAVDYIEKILADHQNDKSKIENILLVGYEKYSELFLTTLKYKTSARLVGQIKHCEYCIYETDAILKDNNRKEETSIRRLNAKKYPLKVEREENDTNGNKSISLNCDNTLCLFIVPINTSLSTMDKMVAKFVDTVKEGEWHKEYLCLITLCSNDEFYEFVDENEKELGYPQTKDDDTIKQFIHALNGKDYYLKAKEKFEYIAEQKIKNFVISKSDSLNASNCKRCFPDKNGSSLISETPMFGVNRGSVVPMLKFGHYRELKPIKQIVKGTKNRKRKDNKEEIVTNFERVWRLSQYMEYRHVVRSNNHFQFYFHTEKFLENELIRVDKDLACVDIEEWLKDVRDKYKNENKYIFDYLVAPRHSTNAQFVYLVKSIVFNDKARIIFFDVDKEYRSNLSAKYSDLISAINNIKSSNMDYEIRFHFVDDVINSGTSFLNAKNLISSIIAEATKGDQDNIRLFFDGILLINRISKKRRNFYISSKDERDNDYKNFHYFVNVNISPMRSHEDACTLCKLGYDYNIVRENCATNTLADICSKMILTHRIQQYESVVDIYPTSIEKRYLFFITHLINERIVNEFRFIHERIGSIEIEENSESIKSIKSILEPYYNFNYINNYVAIKDCSQPDFKICDQAFIWEIAFIKTISRPFFTYHIRCCQAAFAFCLEKLNNILFQQPECDDVDMAIKNSIRIQTLVKALADMNANYIIRKEVLDKLIYWANWAKDKFKLTNKEGKIELIYEEHKLIIEYEDEIDYIYKRLFKPESLLHYIKKDLVLSRDTTKSLLLEHILLDDKEDCFFDSKPYDVAKAGSSFVGEDNQVSLKGKLYLENNLILRRTLQNDIEKLLTKKADNLYFFENFAKVWKLNTGKTLVDSTEVFVEYKDIIESLQTAIRDKKIDSDFSKIINELFDKLGASEMKALAFLHDSNEKNNLFRFFTLFGMPYESGEEFDCKLDKELLTSQAFFYEDNITKISDHIEKENGEDVYFIDDVLTERSKKSLIVRFSIDKHVNNNEKKQEKVQQEEAKKEEVQQEEKVKKEEVKAQDNSIYFQIWGFNKDNHMHWFALKLLLTLRNNFVTLIKEINLQELIEERKVGMQRTALAIVKAVTHNSTHSFINYNICDVEFNKDYRKIYIDAIKQKDNANIVFDKYFHVIANEYISSLYRKVIRNEQCLFHKQEVEASGVVEDMLEGLDLSKDDSVWLYVFGDAICERTAVKIEIENKLDGDGADIVTWSKLDGQISALAHVLFLFAVNAAKYGKKEKGIVNFKIEINEVGLIFINEIADDKEGREKELIKFTKIPPWVFKKEDQHITLWTLLQMNKRRLNNNYIYIKPSYYESNETDENKLYYKVEIDFNKNEGEA